MCEVYLLTLEKTIKKSIEINKRRLQKQGKAKLFTIDTEKSIPEIPSGSVIIDGLFGSGLNRQLEGVPEKVVKKINSSGSLVVSIDMPSGLFGEDNSRNDLSKVVRANFTLTFQFPKLSFFFPEHSELLGKWEILPIGLHPEAFRQISSPYNYLNEDFFHGIIRKREKFSHKGNYGHALLIAGSYGKMGAAVLASRACLRSGVGLLTTHVPHSGCEIMQTSVPEAMCSIDSSDFVFSQAPATELFTAIGIGPGLGTDKVTEQALTNLLKLQPSKIILDADALNIISKNRELLEFLPENAVLTPHPKEFERLAGVSTDSYSRLKLQLDFSKKHKVVVVLKGAHTCITLPDGDVFFNTTGNPGMATAGCGDVLTGIILALLAQNYSPCHAARIGVFVHGLAGDLSAVQNGEISLTASDLVSFLGAAFLLKQN